ncbi:FAD dependent oxidoreductase TIGR03364 [Pseudarcicella hirudinis]|uniref:FAD dependent oxidoreductase TIGR03364 n=1 Tax=Pseudarcicella hirudinis TaxID=1079859 RepID=A0A1I5NMJ7_9BACT|nr:TIGR03364 family FAD-dependent oxidoreductase [Pseudarcicella hirudinis]SFP23058.1 FAD dependent oxidoreductase TIGR03364 [Pseudarcicella hirudinis]
MKQIDNQPSAIVIGAGIVGLAISRSLAIQGYKVQVFERHEKAVGASIRNFGMIWPIGQPNGKMYNRAMKSRSIWKEICDEAELWYEEAGSIHLAYSELEAQVMQEIAEGNAGVRNIRWLNTEEVLAKTPAANPAGLKGGLWSGDEMIVESRVAIQKLPEYLSRKYDIGFHFSQAVSGVEGNTVFSGKKTYHADKIFICSGADFETLYPEIFAENHFTKCKLQMMRIVSQPENWRIGPSLCGGLSLIHYKGFEMAPSLAALKKHYEENMPEYLQNGIHVMVSQNGEGELTIGDSHEYGLHLDPFDRSEINQLIVSYLKEFASFKNWEIAQSWNGTYPKRTNGEADFVYQPAENVWIVNGMGGAGMTLSFGLAEEVITEVLSQTL